MNINSPEEGSEDDLSYVNGSFLDRFIISVDTLIHPNYIYIPSICFSISDRRCDFFGSLIFVWSDKKEP